MANAFQKVAHRTHSLFVNGYKTPGLDINTLTADGLHLDDTASRLLVAPVLAIMAR
jgi:acyl-CoA thioesterase-1